MSSATQTIQAVPAPKWMFWVGVVLSALPVLMLLMSATFKFIPPTPDMETELAKIGLNGNQLLGLGILELTCVIIYLIPRTSVLGAILLTGYMGGAIATHVRVGDFNIFMHVLLGVLVWLGMYLRDARLRELIPVKR